MEEIRDVSGGKSSALWSGEDVKVSLKVQKYIWEASRLGLISRETLQSAIKQFDLISSNSGSFFTYDIDGNLVYTLVHPSELESGPELNNVSVGYIPAAFYSDKRKYWPELRIRPVQELIDPDQSWTLYKQGTFCPIWVDLRSEPIKKTEDNKPIEHVKECCQNKPIEYFKDLLARWQDTRLYTDLKRNIGEKATNGRWARKVVCFDLGSLEDDSCFLQHAVAATIRDTLSKRYGNGDIELSSQYRGYCVNCKYILEQLFDFEVQDNHRALLSVDEFTFALIGELPEDAISQAILSMTRKDNKGGPAALLRTAVHDDGSDASRENGKDWSSPLVYEWTQRCYKDNRTFYLSDSKTPPELQSFGEAEMKFYWPKA